MSDKRMILGGELAFDESAHAYTFNGEFVPGVTTVLGIVGKPALVPWAAGMAADHFHEQVKAGRTDYAAIHKEAKAAHRTKTKAAADIGSNVHAYAEADLKGLPLPALLSDQAKRGVEAYLKWKAAHKVEMLASERRLFSKEHYYAGTCDLVARVDGQLVVGDFKTSSGIYPEMRLQTAAYQQALQEEKEMRFDARLIIRFDKKSGEFEAKTFTEFEDDLKGFLAALTLHRIIQRMAA